MSEQSNKLPIGILFRQKREEKGLLIRQVAAVTELDQAIISRIENCDRHLYSLKLHNKEDRSENFYTKDEDAPKKKAKKS